MSNLSNVILNVCSSGQNRVSLVSLGAGGITCRLTRRVGAVDPLHSSLQTAASASSPPPRPFLCRRSSTSNENTEENHRSETSADTRTQCSAEISVTLSPEPPETQLKLTSECVNVKPSGPGVTLACQTSCMRPVTSEYKNLNLWCLESFTWAVRPQVTSVKTVTVRYDVFPPECVTCQSRDRYDVSFVRQWTKLQVDFKISLFKHDPEKKNTSFKSSCR